MQPRERRGTGGAAVGRPPVLSKEMNSTIVSGANTLKGDSNPDSE